MSQSFDKGQKTEMGEVRRFALKWDAVVAKDEQAPEAVEVERGAGSPPCPAQANACQPGPGTVAYNATFFDVYDDFFPASSGALTKVCIRGIWYNGAACFGGAGNVANRAANWRVTFFPTVVATKLPNCTATIDNTVNALTLGRRAIFSNIAGEPGVGGIRAFASVATGQDGTFGTTGLPLWVQLYDLGTGVNVAQGTCYWVRMQNAPPTSNNCSYFWETKDPAQTGVGNNQCSFVTRDTVGAPTCVTAADLQSKDMNMCYDRSMSPGTACLAVTAPGNPTCAFRENITCGASFDYNNALETAQDPTDPHLSCDTLNPTPWGTIWYDFVATNTRAVVDTCATTGLLADSVLAVFRFTNVADPCGSLVEIACSDDGCTGPGPGGGANPLTQICLSGLTVGQHYIVCVASIDDTSMGAGHFSLTCPGSIQPPANDHCPEAIAVSIANPDTQVTGTTTCADVDQQANACGDEQPGVGGGVWYDVVGTGETLHVTFCDFGTQYDTQVSVYCGDCNVPICIAGNDDGCTEGTLSDVSFCSEVGKTYHIMVHGFFSGGDFTFHILREGACTTDPVDCATCSIPACSGTAEGENCGDQINPGCGAVPPVFQLINSNVTICGTAWAALGTRDIDAYEFNLSVRSLVTWSVTAEFEPVAILRTNGCDQVVTFAAVTDVRCGTAVASAVLNPGTYSVLAFHNGFNGFPCSGNAIHYTGVLATTPIGCCAFAGGGGNNCVFTTASDCTQLGGSWESDDSGVNVVYTSVTCSVPFAELPVGTDPLVLTLEDDDAVTVVLPTDFSFELFNEVVPELTVSSNGTMSMDGFFTVGPQVIPATGPIDGYIALYARDLDPSQGGEVRVVVTGASPNRKIYFIYENVPVFNSIDTFTGEAVLFEGSNCIQLHYGDADGLGFPADSAAFDGTNGNFTAGIESPLGFAAHGNPGGYSVSTNVASGDRCREFCPTVSNCCDGIVAPVNQACCFGDGTCQDLTPAACTTAGGTPQGSGTTCATTVCPLPPCIGDINGDRRVGLADIARIIQCWNQPASCNTAADLDGSGAIGLGDIAKVIQHWACCCSGASPACGSVGGDHSGGTCNNP
ncbi:MAG TPA: dockerin type I domain-containing protein [Phycisphaerales bacterium]|nr:dockerin type I domain-containing protein [Phycisphaerales bacterium]